MENNNQQPQQNQVPAQQPQDSTQWASEQFNGAQQQNGSQPNNAQNTVQPNGQPVPAATPMDPKTAAVLAYLVTPFTGFYFYATEKQNQFVRFHAMQSIIFGLAAFAASIVSGMLTAVVIGFLLLPIVNFGAIILWGVLMYKAYNGEEYELPILGKIAREQMMKHPA